MGKDPLTRDDLLKIIADAIRAHATYISESQAVAIADTILHNFKAAGIRVVGAKKERQL